MFAPSYSGTGPRCPCGCPYLRGLVLLPLVLTTSPGGGIGIAGTAVRDLPVESLTCKACLRRTITRDLPPIGVDVTAVLEQLADGRITSATVRPRVESLNCLCGAQRLTWSSVITITVHMAGETMLGEVSSGPPGAAPTGTLSCPECSRSWESGRSDLPAQIQDAFLAFTGELSVGEVGWHG